MRQLGIGAAAAGLLTIGCAVAQADVIWTASTTGGQDSDGNLAAQATIDIGNGTMQVTLTNTEADTSAIGQSISGIVITLTDVMGNVSLTSATGQLIDIGNGDPATITPVAGNPTHWGVNASSNTNTIGLATAGGYAPGSSPVDLIAGSPPYTANSGDPPHDPSIEGTATFGLSVVGLTMGEMITAVNFLFGTGPDTTTGQTVTFMDTGSTPVPEPASLLLLASGVLGLGLLRRRTAPRANAENHH